MKDGKLRPEANAWAARLRAVGLGPLSTAEREDRKSSHAVVTSTLWNTFFIAVIASLKAFLTLAQIRTHDAVTANRSEAVRSASVVIDGVAIITLLTIFDFTITTPATRAGKSR